MSTHVHLNVFKVFLWRLCKKKLNGVQYTNLKIKPNCQLSDGILAFDAIKIRNRFVPLKCYEAKLAKFYQYMDTKAQNLDKHTVTTTS